jgi:predicted RNA methylase
VKKSGRRRALGQYFTPDDAASFVLRAATEALGRRPRSLLDPSCGDGAFLRGALALKIAPPSRLFGIEIDPAAARAVRPASVRARVSIADALDEELPRAMATKHRGFDLVAGNPPFAGGRGSGRLEVRFARRFVELTADGGAGGIILPHGVFANASSQRLRDDLLGSAHPLAVVELPRGLFRAAGAAARTFALIYRKRVGVRSATCLIVPWREHEDARRHFARVLETLRRGVPEGAVRVPVARLAASRWDTGYWCTGTERLLASSDAPLAPLGDFVEHITYGPIVTGERRRASEGDVTVIGLRELRPTGLDLSTARRVRAGSVHDPERCRLKRGDLLLARSGVGSLMKGRAAVWRGRGAATVGCFVDLVRLRGIDPGYVLLCLRSTIVREQIKRLANGVGTPNLSFGEIKSLLIPRLGRSAEKRIAREEVRVHRRHAAALRAGREPVEAARALESVARLIDNRSLGGAS